METETVELDLSADPKMIIRSITPFNFPPDPGKNYSGDMGYIWHLERPYVYMENGREIGSTIVQIYIFDTSYFLEMVLSGRFICGDEAVQMYQNCVYTTIRYLRENTTILEDEERTIAIPILRAGAAYSSKNFTDIYSYPIDFKREYTGVPPYFFEAQPKNPEDFAKIDQKYRTLMFEDPCAASGGTDKIGAVHTPKHIKNVIYNINVLTLNTIKRVVPILIEKGINGTFICFGGIFNTFTKKKIVLESGEVIYPATLINCFTDELEGYIVPPRVYQHIYEVFQLATVEFPMDIIGEAGDKIQFLPIKVPMYDFEESFASKLDLRKLPWFPRAKKAWENRSLRINIRETAPRLYEHLIKIFGDAQVKKTKEPVKVLM